MLTPPRLERCHRRIITSPVLLCEEQWEQPVNHTGLLLPALPLTSQVMLHLLRGTTVQEHQGSQPARIIQGLGGKTPNLPTCAGKWATGLRDSPRTVTRTRKATAEEGEVVTAVKIENRPQRNGNRHQELIRERKD